MAWNRDQMAARAARELRRLLRHPRIGDPDTGRTNPRGRASTLQSEKGSRDWAFPYPRGDPNDKVASRVQRAAAQAYFDSAQSFA